MKSFKKVATFAGAALLLAGLAACGNGASKDAKSDKSGGKDDTTTLLMYQIGDKPENYNELMEIANKRIKDEINAEIDLQ